MKALIGAIALVVLCAVARAGEPAPEEISAWRQLSAEYIECVAFYSIVGIIVPPSLLARADELIE
jgi:putative copper export protein